MSERREYFRIPILARVGLRVLAPEEAEQARFRLKRRHVPPAISANAIDESRLLSEHRLLFDLLQRIALTLDRIDRRLDEMALIRNQGERASLGPSQILEITLSASGFSGPFELEVPPGSLVEAHLDLWDSGLPLIPALARVVGVQESEGRKFTAFSFDEILPEDRERIVRLTLKRQSRVIRENRGEDRR